MFSLFRRIYVSGIQYIALHVHVCAWQAKLETPIGTGQQAALIDSASSAEDVNKP